LIGAFSTSEAAAASALPGLFVVWWPRKSLPAPRFKQVFASWERNHFASLQVALQQR
jgi:hypothetical protein